MSSQLKPKTLIGWCVSVAILHAISLFLLIPAVSARFKVLYNQNEYADGYDELATNLVQGRGYRFYPDTASTLMREPGYPVFLAGIFFVSGYSFKAVKTANMFLALASAWIITLIADRISKNGAPSLLPALLFLFHPATLIAESRGGVEILFAFLVTLYVLTIYRALEHKRPSDYVISGFVLGLAVLVKSTPLLFPLFLLPYLMVFRRQGFSKLMICRNVLLMFLAMFTVMSPWIVRNYKLTHKFVPTASVLGISAHAGQFILSHLSSNDWFVLDRQAAQERKKLARELGYPFKEVTNAYYQAFYSTEDELKFSSYLLKIVVDEYRSRPTLYLKALSYNFFNVWFAGKTRESTAINVLVQLPYLSLGVFGVVVAVRKREFQRVAPIILFIIYLVVVYAAILAQARYSVPLIPLVSIVASLGLRALQDVLRGPGGMLLQSADHVARPVEVAES